MTTCATGVLAFSNITLRVVDNWASAREVIAELRATPDRVDLRFPWVLLVGPRPTRGSLTFMCSFK